MTRQEQRGRRKDRRNVFIEKHITSKPPLDEESARTVYAMTLPITVMVTQRAGRRTVRWSASHRAKQQPHPPA